MKTKTDSSPLQAGPHLPVVHVAKEARTLPDLFYRRAHLHPERAAAYEKDRRTGTWTKRSWAQLYDSAARIAQGLIRLGLAPGERVAIVGPTQPQWGCFDMGAQLAGLVSLGLYQQQSQEQLRYLIDHSEARVVFVADEAELRNLSAATKDSPRLLHLVPWDEDLYTRCQGLDQRLLSPAHFRAEPLPQDARREREATIKPDDVAILIYTSGTTGPPKGAMISHRNILSLLSVQDFVLTVYQDDTFLSFLPLAHAAERVLGLYGRISTGVVSAYASSISAVLTELGEVRPTLFGSVPRIFEKAYSKICSEVEHQPAAVGRLFAWATDVGRRRALLELAGRPVPLSLALQHKVADRLVFRKIRQAFGGRVRHMVVGAAPTAQAVLEFFWAAGLRVYEVYGMTEATVLTHVNQEGAVRLGTVGRVIPPLEHRIAPDGEVLLRGPWVFLGYYKNQEATAETVVDGWLHTGDIGSIDQDGYLRITDRKKHIIITAGGKNLTPANIEGTIKSQDPLISQVHVHGDRRAYVAALIAPSPLETLEWGRERGLVSADEVAARTRELLDSPTARTEALNQAMAQVVVHADFARRLTEAVRRGNGHLAHVEHVRRIRILPRDFCQEHGELTPTMKVRRKEVERMYAADFDRIYDEPGYGLEV